MEFGREAVIILYRNLIRESKKWQSYNYRMFALRKIRHEFQKNKALTDKSELTDCFNHGLESLDVIKRQVSIGNIYTTRPLVIETQKFEAKDEKAN